MSYPTRKLKIFTTAFVTCLMSFTVAEAASSNAIAQVPEELRRSEAYTNYSKMLVQIDLMANPKTAYLPVTVSAFRPGSLVVEGRVPNAKVMDYIQQNAKRISGLSVESQLEIGEVSEPILFSPPARELEAEIKATISGFFPEYAGTIRVTVKENGMVELNGEVKSYETKVNISRSLRSQPGCRAVINVIRVAADPNSGIVRISEDASMQLDPRSLPLIPAAPIVDLEPTHENHPSLRRMNKASAAVAADDVPATDLGVSASKLLEDANAIIERDPQLASLGIELEIEDGGIVAVGKLDGREQVEQVINRLSDVPDVTRVTVKSRPFSMQRTIPKMLDKKEEPTPKSWTEKMMSYFPGAGGNDPQSLASSWRFRDNVRRSMIKLSNDRIENLKVRSTMRGLVIEGEVSSTRDRAFIFKQANNLPELRPIATDVILKITGNQ